MVDYEITHRAIIKDVFAKHKLYCDYPHYNLVTYIKTTNFFSYNVGTFLRKKENKIEFAVTNYKYWTTIEKIAVELENELDDIKVTMVQDFPIKFNPTLGAALNKSTNKGKDTVKDEKN